MHELSIALSLVDLGIEEAERRGVLVVAVHVRLGALSGVVRDALELSYQVAAEGTPLEHSRLVIQETAGTDLELVALEVANEHSSAID
ncbi:MAG TPA: hydrogenase maturation nickel metallochaperone HypA [Terriglobia bacterium]|nr:hydrogenase maturation nickel metallochaperone HypA [Terriglobia bacterium]